MRIHLPQLVIASIAATGCNSSDGKEANAAIVHQQIGRFEVVNAQGNLPALVLDTATGCVMAVDRDEDGQVEMQEVHFDTGEPSCNAMKQLLVVDTFSRVVK